MIQAINDNGKLVFLLSDFPGPLCETTDPLLALALVKLNSDSPGALRDLVSGTTRDQRIAASLNHRQRLRDEDLALASPKSSRKTLKEAPSLSDLGL